MHRGPYRLLTIDLDDTLWPCGPVIAAAESALYDWLRGVAPRLTAAHDEVSLRERRKLLMASSPEQSHDLTWVRRESLRVVLIEHGYPETLADEGVALFRRHRNRVEPYADVKPALRRLFDRYRLVSVTNGNVQLERTPLSGLFHYALSAADVGAAKPDPAIFRQALDWAGVDPGRCLHVGDDPVRDVDAARRLGIDGAWINRTGAIWPDGVEPPVYELSHLGALWDALCRRA